MGAELAFESRCFGSPGDGIAKYQKSPRLTSPTLSARRDKPSAHGRMAAPRNEPARLVRRVAYRGVERKIGDCDQLPVPVQQRQTATHPRHDARIVQPTLERDAARTRQRRKPLAARAKAKLESVVEPRLRQALAPAQGKA